MIESLWAALGGAPQRAAEVEIRGAGRYLPSAFDVDGLAVGAAGAALLAAAELVESSGARRPAIALDAEHVAVAFVSERHVVPAPTQGTFASLSRFAPTRDGWIRLHANYPHHLRALLEGLGTDEDGALTAIAGWDAEELETAIVDAGGAAAATRTPEAWSRHPQGVVAASLPLIDRTTACAALVRSAAGGSAPAAGIRVLDLTRVIAGPVATRMLAALGADVLRIDPPQMPELELAIQDGCPGKRRARLDLRTDAATFDELLAGADVLVHGYRPGALGAFGVDDAALAARHPHLTIASLSAWGHAGPWSERRGFDSLVQSACGIATVEGDTDAPGALPAQALDHATGYLLAATVLRGLACRRRGEDATNSRLALTATAAELMRHAAADTELRPARPDPWLIPVDDGMLVAPPGELDGHRLSWRHGARDSAPAWDSFSA
jgi:hypothetical protein